MLKHLQRVADSRFFNKTSPLSLFIQEANPKLCVITGSNASGKSLVRKILHTYHHNDKIKFITSSQEDRCSGNLYGLHRVMVYGSEQDDSTGFNSIRLVKKAVQSCNDRQGSFSLMVDEPEIGCSEEVQAALGDFISKSLDLDNPNLNGVFVITHSRLLVKMLMPLSPTHVCLSKESYSLNDWINREITPVDLDEILELNKQRYCQIQSLINEGEKK